MPMTSESLTHGVLLEEESLKELEAKNGKYFRFTVSNAALAANLLQSKLGIQNIQVDSANELTVRDLRLDTGAAGPAVCRRRAVCVRRPSL